MRILFSHTNYPGQYLHLQPFLAQDRTVQCVALTLESNTRPISIPHVKFAPHRQAAKETHPYVRSFENAVLHGQNAYKACMGLKAKGFVPDVVLAHTGWGAPMFIKDAFPDAKLIGLFEWYYHARGSDADFLNPADMTDDSVLRIRTKNAHILQDLSIMDWGVNPTRFQNIQFPDLFRSRMSVLHDGVETDFCAPYEKATLEIAGRTFSRSDEIITYVARGMEPYRGFPQFMGALAKLQRRRPHAQAIIIGSDRVAYGATRKDQKTWKEAALESNDLDMDRVHFTGTVTRDVFRDAMQVSTVHVYLTVPFVLSWSMMEAMSCGAVVLASDTAPVREVIEDGRNGFLTDFFDTDTMASRIDDLLSRRDQLQDIRIAARQTITQRYAQRDLLPMHRKLILDVAAGRTPDRDPQRLGPMP